VTDNGIGISDESKIKLFKKFSSVQNMATGSTGLGLYSLLKRSEAINGSCGMDDREDGEQGNYLCIYNYIHMNVYLCVFT
jgi:signal transduction histidine kinase